MVAAAGGGRGIGRMVLHMAGTNATRGAIRSFAGVQWCMAGRCTGGYGGCLCIASVTASTQARSASGLCIAGRWTVDRVGASAAADSRQRVPGAPDAAGRQRAGQRWRAHHSR